MTVVDPNKKRSDSDWGDYVLSFLTPEEIQDGHAKVDGLRRISELFVGEIVASHPRTIQSPSRENGGVAVVEYHLEFETPSGKRKVFGGVADVSFRNTDAPYSSFSTSTADTRAEGRALKRALGLSKPVAEEMANVTVDDPSVEEDTDIRDPQVKTIATLCKRLDISVKDFVNSGRLEYNTIKDVKYKTALEMIKRLNVFQQDMDKIPQELKGFDPNWQSSFGG